MKPAEFRGYALSVSMAAAMLAGCGGSQPAIGAPGARPQSPAIATLADGSGSWMLPEAAAQDLLYVAAPAAVSVFSYPSGKRVGSLSGLKAPFGMCTDPRGHVYVVDVSTQTIVEYDHSGTEPIRTLTDSPNWPYSCEVNPINGDLAVSGGVGHGLGTSSNIAIFKGARGTPKVYISQYFDSFQFCTYDDGGNLFATAGQDGIGVLAELAAGGEAIRYITVNKSFGESADVQWVHGLLVLADPTPQNTGPATFYQVKVSGTTGTVVKSFQLSSGAGNLHANDVGFWVRRSTIIYPKVKFSDGNDDINNLGVWDYPAGGMIKKTIKVAHPLTVMVAQHT